MSRLDVTAGDRRPSDVGPGAGVRLTVEPLDGPVAAPLLGRLVAELQRRYDDDGAPGAPLDPVAFRPPHGTFLVAHVAGRPAGCGGLRTHTPGVGEVKRMYVDPTVRRRGVARLLLAALEDAGRTLGHRRLLLETGTQQPEALALYDSAGWTRIPPYGEWRDSPLSVCYARDL